ncbi:MAG: hypothetical protein ACTHNS_14335 [Marmoricola sp.]
MSRHTDFDEFVANRSRALLDRAGELTEDPRRAEELLETALARSYLVWRRIPQGDDEDHVLRALTTGRTPRRLRAGREERPPDRIDPIDRAGRARALARSIRRRRRRTVAAVLVAATVAVAATAVGRGSGTGSGSGTGTDLAGRPALSTRGCTAGTCPTSQVIDLLSRPLRLPHVTSGGRCPVTRTRLADRPVQGFTGPVRLAGAGPLAMIGFAGHPPSTILARPSPGGVLEQKVVWAFASGYAGPLLLRGGRIDAPGSLRFDRYLGAYGYRGGAGAGPQDELFYPRGGLGATPHATGELESAPSGVYVTAPGCYAIQADGEYGAGTIVFRVLRERAG